MTSMMLSASLRTASRSWYPVPVSDHLHDTALQQYLPAQVIFGVSRIAFIVENLVFQFRRIDRPFRLGVAAAGLSPWEPLDRKEHLLIIDGSDAIIVKAVGFFKCPFPLFAFSLSNFR